MRSRERLPGGNLAGVSLQVGAGDGGPHTSGPFPHPPATGSCSGQFTADGSGGECLEAPISAGDAHRRNSPETG